jgi:hypothetical protein
MRFLKTSWEKEKKKEIPIEVMNHIAARGSFVVVKSKRLYKDINDTVTSTDTGHREVSFADQLNDRIKSINFSLWMENIADNFVSIKNSSDISKIPKGSGKSAIIVGAGPSFREKNHIALLKQQTNGSFDIISTDRMFIPLLKAGIVPAMVVSADGHRELIAPFYRSDLITKDLKTIAVMATMVAPNVVAAFPGKCFFFTPMIDDIDQPFSLSSAISAMTRTSILSTGGNVGITSIFVAFYLGYKNIILTGMDQGYTMNTPIEQSQYYPIIKEADPTMTPEKYKETYIIEGYNPDFDVQYYTDITWKAHIDHIVEESVSMSGRGITLINATEGGCIHGGTIKSMTLKEAMQKYA